MNEKTNEKMNKVKYGYISSVIYYLTIQNVKLEGYGNIKIMEKDKILYSQTYEKHIVLDFITKFTDDACIYKLNGEILFVDKHIKDEMYIVYDSTFKCTTSTFVHVDH